MRADVYFKDKFGSRTKAAEAIEKGLVLVNGKPIRAKDEIKETDEISFVSPKQSFVSNGGYKLARAQEAFSLSFDGRVCVDLGASTGGFTDCLLQGGAKTVYAVDVGESLLDPAVANSERVIVMDKTNARYLTASDFSETVEVAVCDVSFISLRHIFPAIQAILANDGYAVTLVKPQFESENKNIGKSGIVSPCYHEKIVEKVISFATENGLYPFDITNAPIRKGKNIEYVVLWKKTRENALNSAKTKEKIKEITSANALGTLV